ncbi:hypothetical protein [Verrucomicrobium sp. BvORR106]|uniref:hypothetical protein n=1 Tax=Verrucomicrobium sp. BvORR106 TaxID=1403819 RepID=UPI000570EB08|nr:hypothetical protein [Verrucomicrobium sp. BvORR106]
MKIKIFNSHQTQNLETLVNEWLSDAGESIEVKQMLQSESAKMSTSATGGMSYTITVYYLDLH